MKIKIPFSKYVVYIYWTSDSYNNARDQYIKGRQLIVKIHKHPKGAIR